MNIISDWFKSVFSAGQESVPNQIQDSIFSSWWFWLGLIGIGVVVFIMFKKS